MATHPAFFTRGRAIGAAAIVVAGAVLALASCKDNNPTQPNPGGPTIHIVAGAFNKGPLAYSPSPDTVSVGTTVTWKNDDSMTHTVTSNTAGQFNMTIGSGSTASHQFSTAGSFPYHCAISGHTMSGIVVAQ